MKSRYFTIFLLASMLFTLTGCNPFTNTDSNQSVISEQSEMSSISSDISEASNIESTVSSFPISNETDKQRLDELMDFFTNSQLLFNSGFYRDSTTEEEVITGNICNFAIRELYTYFNGDSPERCSATQNNTLAEVHKIFEETKPKFDAHLDDYFKFDGEIVDEISETFFGITPTHNINSDFTIYYKGDYYTRVMACGKEYYLSYVLKNYHIIENDLYNITIEAFMSEYTYFKRTMEIEAKYVDSHWTFYKISKNPEWDR